jgi:hypothetical protein
MFMPYRHHKKKEDLGLKTIIIDTQPTRMINTIVKRKTSIAAAESEAKAESNESENENILNDMIWEII